VGYHSLYANTGGLSNSGFGWGALQANLDGQNNTGCGVRTLELNTTGDLNTAVGNFSLNTNTTGSNNTALGADADVSASGLSNATALGYSASVDASNKVRVGNTSVSSIGGQVGWTNFSDVRIKDNIKENVPGLLFINKLRPVTFHYNVRKENALLGVANEAEWTGKYDIEKIPFTGFIAQEVAQAAKNSDYDFSGVDKSGEIMGLRYSEFVAPLVKAVQELSRQNEELQRKTLEQDEKIERLTNRLNELKASRY
jgi:hypothetical protein